MNRHEWQTARDPVRLLRFLGRTASERRMRLFASACCRRHASVTRGKKHLLILEANEMFADGLIDQPEMDRRRRRWFTFDGPFPLPGTWQMALACATLANTGRRKNRMERWAIEAAEHLAQASRRPDQEKAAQVQLVYDLFGNPFRRARIGRGWLTWHDATVPKLAQTAYDERDLTSGHLDSKRLAILADALEEAGCSSEDILAHLRGPGPHVRGCWVIDLVMRKE
jgi:hypothetical protein